MTTVIMIASVTRDLGLGRGGDLLYHISEDLRRFKRLTMGCPIIMGRRTFESFPSGALPGRRNIVLTRGTFSAPGVETAATLEEALAMCSDAERVFVIGGGQVYKQAMPLAHKLEITLVDAYAPDADTRFPTINPYEWQEIASSERLEDPRTGVAYRFVSFERVRDNS